MKTKLAFAALLALSAASGCIMPPPPPTERPEASSKDFDALWQATRDAVERHFELYIQRKDTGYMASTYKRAEPVPFLFTKDAQTGYDTLEDFMHVVRRRLYVRILEDRPGTWVVHLEVIRERQGYVPPETWYSTDYDIYDPNVSLLNDAADVRPSVTWYPLGRDLYLENALLNDINERLAGR